MHELVPITIGYLERTFTRGERAMMLVGLGWTLATVAERLPPMRPKPPPTEACGPAGPYATSGPYERVITKTVYLPAPERVVTVHKEGSR